MQKEFQRWHVLKSHLHESDNKQYFHERDIWWCSLGCNVGAEEDGKGDIFSRPVLIIRKFGPDLYWALPLTSTMRRGFFYYQFSMTNGRRSTAIVSQLRILDVRRLVRRMGKMQKDDFEEIKKRIVTFLTSE